MQLTPLLKQIELIVIDIESMTLDELIKSRKMFVTCANIANSAEDYNSFFYLFSLDAYSIDITTIDGNIVFLKDKNKKENVVEFIKDEHLNLAKSLINRLYSKFEDIYCVSITKFSDGRLNYYEL